MATARTEHRAAVFRDAGHWTARCLCGWAGAPRAGYDAAEAEGQLHLHEAEARAADPVP